MKHLVGKRTPLERFFRKQNDGPRFKSKKNRVQSYTTKWVNGKIAVVWDRMKRPKRGLVRCAGSRDIEGRILNATITRSSAGNCFVSILADVESAKFPRTGRTCGVDVGQKIFAVVSDGTVYENPEWFKKREAKLAKEQRILSGREKGSAKWKEQRIRVARVHDNIANARADVLHKTTTMIVKNHDIIGIEDLRISNLLNNANLSKTISEVSWILFRTMLECKADWYGKQVVPVAKTLLPASCALPVVKETKPLRADLSGSGPVPHAVRSMTEILTQACI